MENNQKLNFHEMMELDSYRFTGTNSKYLDTICRNVSQSGMVEQICILMDYPLKIMGSTVLQLLMMYMCTFALNALVYRVRLTAQYIMSFWDANHLSDDDNFFRLIRKLAYRINPGCDRLRLTTLDGMIRNSFEQVASTIDVDLVGKFQAALYAILWEAAAYEDDPEDNLPEEPAKISKVAPPWEAGHDDIEQKGEANFTVGHGNRMHRDRVLIPHNCMGPEEPASYLLKEKLLQRMSDIAGLYDVKAELRKIISYMKDPDYYKSAGATMPKGMMLYGPPGTGKTLIAKAVAGECGCNFIALTGGDFTASKWGENERFVNDIFKEARENAPCIIFIDEIDTIGMKRVGSAVGNGIALTSFLNPLLTALDGFKSGDGIFVIAATNRIDTLDDALLRPGRFDYKLCVPNPTTEQERNEVIEMYLHNKKISEELDIGYISRRVTGLSPAEIKTILNDAAIIAVEDSKDNGDKADFSITVKAFNEAFLKFALGGNLKENPSDNPEDQKITAYHEAGHALAGILFGKEVNMVTIRESTTGAAGITCFMPNSSCHYSKTDMENDIMVAYSGRAAEELVFGDANITGGASKDINKATKLLKEMTMRLGMDGYGLLDYTELGGSGNVQFEGIQKRADDLYNGVKCLLLNHMEYLDRIAEELLVKKTLEGLDLGTICREILENPDAETSTDML